MNLLVPQTTTASFESDTAGNCERAAIRESVERSYDWTAVEQDRASALLRDIFQYRFNCGQVDVLLLGAHRGILQAAIGPICGITARSDNIAFPMLRFCNFRHGTVCFFAGPALPLLTKPFLANREYLEQVWGGPVAIGVGPIPGSILVRAAPPMITAAARVPPAPQMPLALPARIPLKISSEGGGE